MSDCMARRTGVGELTGLWIEEEGDGGMCCARLQFVSVAVIVEQGEGRGGMADERMSARHGGTAVGRRMRGSC